MRSPATQVGGFLGGAPRLPVCLRPRGEGVECKDAATTANLQAPLLRSGKTDKVFRNVTLHTADHAPRLCWYTREKCCPRKGTARR